MKQRVTRITYGFEPGVAQRIDPENRFYKELSPTLRQNAGDNQVSIVTVAGLVVRNEAEDSDGNKVRRIPRG